MFYIGFPILSLIYIIILLIVYFSKKRIDLFENKVVSTLMIINAIGLVLELLCYAVLVFLKIQDTIPGMAILKTYIFYMYIFDWILTGYICMLTSKKYDTENYHKEEYYRKSLAIFSPIIIIGFFITFFTKLEYHNISPEYYTYGLSTDFLVYFTTLLAPFWIYRCIRVTRTKKSREYNIRIGTILLGIILVGISGALMQLVDRSMLILTSAHTIMLVLMYFTIENPDLQMVEELSKNKKLTEQNFEEKTYFIFKISQELKKPLQDITKLSNRIYEESEGNIKEQAQSINTSSKQLYTYVNKALNISTMDIKNLKIVESIYNTKNFFEEIKLRTKSEIQNQNKKLELRYNISKDIPQYLCGDNTKLKQAIISVILDSIKHTSEGFIELDVESIVRYDICRLMINIRNSGKKIELDKINSILSISEDITKEELEKIDKLNITLPLAHKIIKSLNGSLIIKSDIDNGTNFLIVIDQKIENKEKIEKTSLEHYSKKITNQKRIMLVCNNPEIIKTIKENLKGVEITSSLFAKDCINELKKEKNYECIIIDEDLNEESGNNLLEEIKKIDSNIPSIILLNENNEFLEKHYLSDGFDNTIKKENITKEKDKIKKYL